MFMIFNDNVRCSRLLKCNSLLCLCRVLSSCCTLGGLLTLNEKLLLLCSRRRLWDGGLTCWRIRLWAMLPLLVLLLVRLRNRCWSATDEGVEMGVVSSPCSSFIVDATKGGASHGAAWV